MNNSFVRENPGAIAEGIRSCQRMEAGLRSLMAMTIAADKGGDRRGGVGNRMNLFSKTSAKEEKWHKN